MKDLLNTNSACFILPSCWEKFEVTLKSCLSPASPGLTARYERLVQRNRCLTEIGRLRKDEVGQSPREQLIRHLDSVRTPFNIHRISEMCLKSVENFEAAVEILLEWIATPYREGQEHVYLSVRLLRKWNKLGYDTDKPILSFLASTRSITRLRKRNLYRLVTELVRSRQFSVGKYCQWLLARGALSDRAELKEVIFHSTGVRDFRCL